MYYIITDSGFCDSFMVFYVGLYLILCLSYLVSHDTYGSYIHLGYLDCLFNYLACHDIDFVLEF